MRNNGFAVAFGFFFLALSEPYTRATEIPEWPKPVTELTGDTNGDQKADVSDAVWILGYLFLGGPAPLPLGCGADLSAWWPGDINHDWNVDLSDAVFLLTHLFLGGAAPESACEYPKEFPCDATPYCVTYGEWTARWWQWDLCIPTPKFPQLDPDGRHCAAGQSGPVFFLAGTFGADPITRDLCVVPAGKSILFAILNAECSTLEDPPFDCTDEPTCRECAAKFFCQNDPARCPGEEDSVQATLEDKGTGTVEDLHPCRVKSPYFRFSLPDDNILGLDQSEGFSASDGYWVFLSPLKKGRYIIHWKGEEIQGPTEGFEQDVTFDLTVE